MAAGGRVLVYSNDLFRQLVRGEDPATVHGGTTPVLSEPTVVGSGRGPKGLGNPKEKCRRRTRKRPTMKARRPTMNRKSSAAKCTARPPKMKVEGELQELFCTLECGSSLPEEMSRTLVLHEDVSPVLPLRSRIIPNG